MSMSDDERVFDAALRLGLTNHDLIWYCQGKQTKYHAYREHFQHSLCGKHVHHADGMAGWALPPRNFYSRGCAACLGVVRLIWECSG